MKSLIRKPSAWIPIAMSLTALAILLGFLVMYGVVHEEDEGTAAHLFQILMGGQAPIIAFFLIKWLPQKPKETLQVLALQIVAALLVVTPVFLLGL
ncbi:MAG: hypothetical protein Q7R90_03635 [bacterium]|nr:hypothetical protein [bacterium]